MAWLGLFAGIVVGALIWQVPGALVLGFLGWLAGFIISSSRKTKEEAMAPVQSGAREIHWSLSERLDAMERRLASLERQMAGAREGVAGAGVIPAKAGIQDAAQPVAGEAVFASRPLDPALRRDDIAAASEPLTPAEAAVIDRAAPKEPAPPKRPTIDLPPPPPPEPPTPNPFVEWLFGGNTIVRVGVIVLFFGLAFLVKYGVEHQMIPVEMRVAGVGAAGLILLILGWRLRHKRAGYALSLQGAGVAVLYLTIFGAMKLYNLIPPPMAFALLVAIAVLSAFLAVAQDSLAFAIFAEAGGFMAPILASTGQGNHVMLFSYYLLLNASIVLIAWFKAWRFLNLVGFLFTALIGIAWGVRSYRPELFSTTEPFLVAFFLVYVAIAILFARKAEDLNQRYVDGTIVFGTPIFAFGMQAGLMKGIEFGLAFSSVAAAALYLVTAWALFAGGRDRFRMLGESFLALGVVFATLAIPLALDARWTSAAWALEGAAMVWVGLRQHHRIARLFGVLLQLAAGGSFVIAQPMVAGPPFADAIFVGAMIMALTGIASYRLLARPEADMSGERVLSPIFFVWALGWLLISGGHEIHTFVAVEYWHTVWVAFLGGLALVFGVIAMRRGWREARWPGYALAPVLIAFAFWDLVDRAHPFGEAGWAAWPFAIAVLFFLLKKSDLEDKSPLAMLLHVLGVALISLVGALEIEWVAVEYTARGTAWALASRIVAPSLMLLLISSRGADHRWPVRDHLAAYRTAAATLLIVAMGVWSLHVNWAHAGGSEPLPYMPVLNALDLAHILAIIAIVSAVMAARRSGLARPEFLTPTVAASLAGAVAFIWANSMLLRTIHHWAGVPYRFEPLMRSVVVQASLSVFWSVLALALMVYATRKATRAVWVVGAVLMAVVVAKLVVIDLSRLGGIERIVSFIGVGILMLVIGYFSPVPPRRVEGT